MNFDHQLISNMKRIFVLCIICLLSLQAIAQQKTTISGKFVNCTDLKLELVPSTGNFKDSILVKPDGTFSYTTTAIKAPFLLDHSTGNWPKNDEIDEPIIYADYYFLEALLRQSNKDAK